MFLSATVEFLLAKTKEIQLHSIHSSLVVKKYLRDTENKLTINWGSSVYAEAEYIGYITRYFHQFNISLQYIPKSAIGCMWPPSKTFMWYPRTAEFITYLKL